VSSFEKCGVCGLRYDGFKTGLTFGDVYSMFWSNENDNRTFVNKSRNVILGKWSQIKREMWEEHVEYCERCEAEFGGADIVEHVERIEY